VTELLLDYIDGRVLASQLACVGVTEAVEMNSLLDARLSPEPTHQCSHVALEKGRSLESADNRLATIQAQFSTPIQPSLN
jgi:hypothetical protein